LTGPAGTAATKVAVLGGGAWGTALGCHLAGAAGAQVRLWVHDEALARTMGAQRENPAYLPGFALPGDLQVTPSLTEALDGAAVVVLAIPSHFCREILEGARQSLKSDPLIVVASKGIENGSLRRVSEIVGEVLGPSGGRHVVVLSGPSFAKEVAAGRPTAIVAASSDPALARSTQTLFSRDHLRIYTSVDSIGVEMGGALKNVIAIAAGVVEGLGLGANTLAALITRGLAEISRLSVGAGGRRETLAGLAGLGDLVLTCTGALSRNRQLGIELARGRRLPEIVAGTKTVAEGVRTARSALDLGRKAAVPMPIIEKVNEVLYEGRAPETAIRELLGRPPRPEED